MSSMPGVGRGRAADHRGGKKTKKYESGGRQAGTGGSEGPPYNLENMGSSSCVAAMMLWWASAFTFRETIFWDSANERTTSQKKAAARLPPLGAGGSPGAGAAPDEDKDTPETRKYLVTGTQLKTRAGLLGIPDEVRSSEQLRELEREKTADILAGFKSGTAVYQRVQHLFLTVKQTGLLMLVYKTVEPLMQAASRNRGTMIRGQIARIKLKSVTGMRSWIEDWRSLLPEARNVFGQELVRAGGGTVAPQASAETKNGNDHGIVDENDPKYALQGGRGNPVVEDQLVQSIMTSMQPEFNQVQLAQLKHTIMYEKDFGRLDNNSADADLCLDFAAERLHIHESLLSRGTDFWGGDGGYVTPQAPAESKSDYDEDSDGDGGEGYRPERSGTQPREDREENPYLEEDPNREDDDGENEIPLVRGYAAMTVAEQKLEEKKALKAYRKAWRAKQEDTNDPPVSCLAMRWRPQIAEAIETGNAQSSEQAAAGTNFNVADPLTQSPQGAGELEQIKEVEGLFALAQPRESSRQ